MTAITLKLLATVVSKYNHVDFSHKREKKSRQAENEKKKKIFNSPSMEKNSDTSVAEEERVRKTKY